MTFEAELLLKSLPKSHFIFPSDASQILSTLLFLLSLILNPFYYYFFPCKHQGGCWVLTLLEVIIHKRGVRFILGYNLYPNHNKKKKTVLTKLTLPAPVSPSLRIPAQSPSLEDRVSGGHLHHVSSCIPKIIF